MRTDKEILDRIETLKHRDWLGTQTGDLASRLTFEAARPLLKDDATSDGWEVLPRDRESVKAEMLDYMPFAWDKANSRRGISAGRSLDHMSAWLWLLGEDAAVDKIDDYSHYGKPQLRAICEAYDWDWRQWDDGRWANSEDGEGDPPPDTVEPLPLRNIT